MSFNKHIQIVLVLSTFIIYTQQQVKDPAFMAKWTQTNQECATEESVDLANANKLFMANTFPEDEKLKCFYRCVNVKFGVLDAAGEVVDDALGVVASNFNNVATKDEIVTECGPLKGADLCDTAYKLMKCIMAAKLD